MTGEAGMLMVPLLDNQLAKTKRKGAEEMPCCSFATPPECCCNLNDTKKQRRMDANSSFTWLFGPAECWKSKKNRKEKLTMPTFRLVGMSISIG